MSFASSSAPVVIVASAQAQHAAHLQATLREASVLHVGDADTLLTASRQRPPELVLLATDLRSQLPLPEVLQILRSRAELCNTRWVALGNNGLGPLLAAGADALIAENTPPQAIALQVRTQLARVRQAREQEAKTRQLQLKVEAWEHEERVRDQLVHMLVHDLKNPISAILGILDVVLEDSSGIPDDLTEMLGLARDESQHLLHLAVNMLDVRKMQAGKMHLNHETLFAPMLVDVVRLARADAGVGLADRQIELAIGNDLTPVRADPDVLRRVFANLISNAVKHTRASGQITVAARQEGNNMLCLVRDDGEGIPEDDLPNLFSAFEQSRLTLHSRFDTGMGLAFCKLAVEQHGGSIWVDSVRGQGSTFTFALPLVQEEEEDFVELMN